MLGTILGSVGGLAALVMTYLGTREGPRQPTIQEVRMSGIVGSTFKNSAPGMMYPGLGLEPLRRSDYEIIGVAKGSSCAKYVALWPLPVFWVKREGGGMKWFSADAEAAATRGAWFRAIESVPEADAMLSPRIWVREEGKFSLWYRQDCVDLRGKAIGIRVERQPSLK